MMIWNHSTGLAYVVEAENPFPRMLGIYDDSFLRIIFSPKDGNYRV